MPKPTRLSLKFSELPSRQYSVLRALRQLRGADAPSSGQYLAEFDQVFEDNPDRLQLVHHYDAPPELTFLLNELFNTDFSRCYLALRSLSCCDVDELWPLIEAVWQEKGWNDYGAHYFILHLFGLRSNWPATALATIEALLQEAIHNQRPQFRKSRPAAILSYSVLFPKQFLDHCQSWLSSTEMPIWNAVMRAGSLWNEFLISCRQPSVLNGLRFCQIK